MLPLALLPLELVLAGLVAAQTSAECPREGLGDKLNNKLGQTPCTVKMQIQQACDTNFDESTRSDCICNTMYYSVCAACAACQGDQQPTWGQWAEDNTCGPSPAPFPPQVQLEQNMVPNWAHQPLTDDEDFNLTAAIESSPQEGLSKAAQVAVPIAVGAGVAILAGVLFWLYRRRKRRMHRAARMRTVPGEGFFSQLRQSAHQLWLRTRSHRLRPSRKDSNWEIDEDNQWLNRSVPPAYRDPYAPPGQEEMHELGVRHTSPHIRETSSSSLLPHIEFPGVHRVPTFLERFIKFKDGIRKSTSYKAKYVSRISPDRTFRIDGSAANSPTTKKFNETQPEPASSHSGSGSRTSFHPHRVSTVEEEDEDIPGGSPVIVERTDFDPRRYPGQAPSEVLVISRDGEDFTLDERSTVFTGSPRTPSTGRQAPSVYPGTPLTSMTQSSWLPSPRRANTSSTVSGAYPHELRSDPDLSAPPSWANKFPMPPQSSAPQPTSARTLAPPGMARVPSADGAMFPSPSRTV